jgi:hypothetical protein
MWQQDTVSRWSGPVRSRSELRELAREITQNRDRDVPLACQAGGPRWSVSFRGYLQATLLRLALARHCIACGATPEDAPTAPDAARSI